MPSPFPGMDPYLEHPEDFPSLHSYLIIYLAEALQTRLSGSYFAKPGERVWVEYGQRYIEPDVNVLQSASQRRSDSEPLTAVLDSPVAVIVAPIPQDEHREGFVQIYAGRGQDKRLVTTIEVLSPSDKTPGDHGQGLYLRKQEEVLGSQVHLVEIDLLRGGTHTTAVPRDAAIARAGHYDYHVCVHRFDERDKYYVYPIQLAQALPQIAIPLLPGDGSVTLDLQAVFTRCYDAGPYAREIDYQRDQPEPPLAADQAAWAKEILHKAGLTAS